MIPIPMLRSLHGAFDRATKDDAVVVLTGRKGYFSAGFDLKVFQGAGTDIVEMLTLGATLAERILSFSTPLLIGCTGHAVAMGVFLLLSADYRVGVSGPYRITANEVAIGLTMRVERALTVPPSAFYPRPGVVSSVVVLHRLATPAANVRDRRWFEQVVRGAFAYRRKTLANSLSLALDLPRERIAAAIAALPLDPDIRGEELDLRSFAALADALAP